MLAGQAESPRTSQDVLAWEVFGNRAVRQGNWKLRWEWRPFGRGDWELFDLAADLAERNEPGDPAWKRLSRKLDYRSLRDWCAVNFGAPHMQRDIGAIQRLLVSNGRATWLGNRAYLALRSPETPYPVVFFSHGLGGARVQSINYTTHLASRGYVVLSADHVGRRMTDLLPCLLSPA